MQLFSNHMLLVAVLAFLAAVLLFEALYLFWRGRWSAEARRVQDRLSTLTGAEQINQPRALKERLEADDSLFEKLALALPRAGRLNALLLQSGLQWSLGRLLLLAFCAGFVVVFLTASMLHPPLLALLAAAAGGAAAPVLYVARKRIQRMRKIEHQLPDALDLMTRALRAGHAFSSSLQMATEEMQDPLAAELRATHDEVNYGVSMQHALTNLSQRVPSMDVRYFVVAVLIQREAGGNLTEILSNLSHLIRERLKLMARVRVLSSEGRLSAMILTIMPFVLGGLLATFNPDFMRPLWSDPLGISMMKVLLIMMGIGVLMLRQIIRIRV
jgi:tight adherence protein B